jgi:hypothetical protein
MIAAHAKARVDRAELDRVQRPGGVGRESNRDTRERSGCQQRGPQRWSQESVTRTG